MNKKENKELFESKKLGEGVSALLEGLTTFRDSCHQRLEVCEQKINNHTTSLKSMTRPVLSGETTALFEKKETAHQRAFDDYLRRGDETGLRALEGPVGAWSGVKSLSVSVDGDGGYLVSPQISQRVQSLMREHSPLRSVVNVVETRMGSIEFLVDKDDMGATWISESGTRAESSTATFAKITIQAHEIYAMPKATQRLLDDSAFDVEGWVAERVADKFTRSENTAFVSGDGVGKPVGFLTKPKISNTSWAWGSLGYVPAGAASGFAGTNPQDVLIDLVYALKSGYRNGAVFLMNSKTASVIRKMKDAEGRYLWTEGYGLGQPSHLLGYPVLIVEDMPDIATDSYPVAFGNFRQSYTVVDGQDIRSLRDPFSAKPHVLFYTTRRVGGDVVNFEGIKLLKCAVS